MLYAITVAKGLRPRSRPGAREYWCNARMAQGAYLTHTHVRARVHAHIPTWALRTAHVYTFMTCSKSAHVRARTQILSPPGRRWGKNRQFFIAEGALQLMDYRTGKEHLRHPVLAWLSRNLGPTGLPVAPVPTTTTTNYNRCPNTPTSTVSNAPIALPTTALIWRVSLSLFPSLSLSLTLSLSLSSLSLFLSSCPLFARKRPQLQRERERERDLY